MTQEQEIVTLDREKFRDLLEVLDAIRENRKPNTGIIMMVSSEVERFAAKSAKSLSTRDPSAIAVIRSIIISIPIPWFIPPKNGNINDQHVWDFVRSLCKKVRAVRALTPLVREALRKICLALIEKLPATSPRLGFS
jgi:hypothetical protein